MFFKLFLDNQRWAFHILKYLTAKIDKVAYKHNHAKNYCKILLTKKGFLHFHVEKYKQNRNEFLN